MMLAMDCLRWITVMALRDRTWAGGRIFDSPGQPADLRMESERAAFTAVYTDDADFEMGAEPGVGVEDLFTSHGKVYLILEHAVAGQALEQAEPAEPNDPAMFRTVPDRNILAATDQGLEARIGFIARQSIEALADPDNEWAELWRLWTPERFKIEVRRGGPGQEQTNEPEGVQRFASRIVRMHLGIIGEPAPGEPLPPDSAWAKFLTLAAGTELDGIARIIRDHIEGEPREPNQGWRVTQWAMTLTEQAVRGIGIGPATSESQETPPLSTVVLDQERGK